MVNAKRSAEWHQMMGNYRPSRHGPRPERAPAPPPQGDIRSMTPRQIHDTFQALPEALQFWDEYFGWGAGQIFVSPMLDGMTEAQARRLAKAAWHKYAPKLIETWGETHMRGSWGWKRYGAPDNFVESMRGEA
jgi:hypothetical protein